MSQKTKSEQGPLLPYYWLNGQLKNHQKHGVPLVPTFSQAMDYSVVLIEGLRVNVDSQKRSYGFRMKDYIKRMMTGWKDLELTSPYTLNQIIRGTEEAARANLLFLKQKGKLQNLYIRPKIYHSDPLIKPFYGSKTNIVIEMFPFGNYLPPSGIAATLADYVRTYRYSSYLTKGAGKYVEYGRLRDRTSSEYADVFQLGLGKGGKLFFTEGSTSNVFFVKKGQLLTAALDDFILPGITRDSVIKMARHLGISVKIGEVPLTTILECEEVFVTGTASFITPINRIGRYSLGIGPVTKKLMKFFEEVRNGKVSEFKHWLTPFTL